MDYEIVYLKEKIVAGLAIRTSNSDSNMKNCIGEAWKKFFEDGIYQGISNKINENTIGLYTNYQNKVSGKYDVIICCEISREQNLSSGVEIRKIAEGKYAKFVVKGNSEKVVGEFWTKLWAMDLNRKYSFDFEEYVGNSEIHIYISIN